LFVSGHLHFSNDQSYTDVNGTVKLIGTPATAFGIDPVSLLVLPQPQDIGWRLLTIETDGSVQVETHLLPEPGAFGLILICAGCRVIRRSRGNH
jgi:hypothetical protein